MTTLAGSTALRPLLEGWGDFYLIVGAAAAALTGLQFVVQTLVGDTLRVAAGNDPEEGILAFGSPTVVHFALALLLSGLLTMPWPAYGGLRAVLAVVGGGALVYSAVVLRRARRQRLYVPVTEDWLWHFVFPASAYAALLVAAALPPRSAEGALFTVGTVTLVLLAIGVHNAWDSAVHLTLSVVRRHSAESEGPPRSSVDGPDARSSASPSGRAPSQGEGR
jgi:hypothetical protein